MKSLKPGLVGTGLSGVAEKGVRRGLIGVWAEVVGDTALMTDTSTGRGGDES